MICPYNQYLSVVEQENLLNEENEDFIGKNVIKQIWVNMQCKEEHCAVWIDGRCHYNG